MDYINIYDFLLLPLYLFFFYFLITLHSKKYEGTPLKKYFITAFFLHMAGTVLYCLVIQYYYGYGDSFGFYQGSNYIRRVISVSGDPFGTFFMNGEDFEKLSADATDSELFLPTGITIGSNLAIMKISALFSYFSFNSYLIISLFFGLFAFTGLWKLFRAFNEFSGNRSEKMLAYTILYAPSVCFWGSGLIKDSICLGAICFICSYLYRIIMKKKIRFSDPLFMILFFYLLFLIKAYLASALLASLILALVLNIIIKYKTNLLKLLSVAGIVFICSLIFIISLSNNISSIVEDSKNNIETFRGVYANPDGEEERNITSFANFDMDINIPNLILRSPVAVFTTLFRPFIWESNKPIMIFSALESLLIFLATIYLLVKCKIGKFFYYIFSDPFLFFCFTFAMILAVIIGFSTFNFGTLVRYRLAVFPFYFFTLYAIYIKMKKPHEPALI